MAARPDLDELRVMQLIDSPASPFCRKVKVVLHETGLAGEVRLVEVVTTPLAPDGQAVASNPLGKIPCLVRDDGPPLYDSRVICRFLDAIEARWMRHLQGQPDAGQIALACALGYLDFRHGARDWRNAHPALSDWYRSFAARPSMESTVPPRA